MTEEEKGCISRIDQKLKDLLYHLYDKGDGKGDIPTIVTHLEKLNGKVASNREGVMQLRVLWGGAAAALIAGILKVFGVY